MGVLEMMEAAKRDSVIHRLNPFAKAMLCIAMIAIPIITINPWVSLSPPASRISSIVRC